MIALDIRLKEIAPINRDRSLGVVLVGGCDKMGDGTTGRAGRQEKAEMPFRMEQVAWPELSLGRFCAATAVLAIVDNLMFYPFDLLKTREHVEKTQLAGRNALAVTYQQ